MLTAYYNENDPYAAAWLRNLIAAGAIPDGDVDERSIADVRAEDLDGYGQCHFFAGIGGWPLALGLAGWPSDRPVWTASCPCPPFSVAGKKITCAECKSDLLVWCPRRTGFAICADCGHAWLADPHHLWPEVWRLAAECRPQRMFGEQVASSNAVDWLAGVRASLEILGYAVGAPDLPAAGVGAPHIRQRLWLVADARLPQRERRKNFERSSGANAQEWHQKGADYQRSGATGGVADAKGAEARAGDALQTGQPNTRSSRSYGRVAVPDGGDTSAERLQRGGQYRQQPQDGGTGGVGVADSMRPQPGQQGGEAVGHGGSAVSTGRLGGVGDAAGPKCESQRPKSDRRQDRLTNPGIINFWSAYDLIPCADGKSRRVEPIFEQMVDGIPPSLGHVCPEIIAEAEREILIHANAAKIDPGKALRDVWLSLSTETLEGWPSGRPDGVHEAPILLSFLRQLTEQGWAFAESISRAGKETQEILLRSLWWHRTAARASCGRGLDEQRPREHSDIMRVLSSILARHAQTAWGEAFNENAAATHPLATGIPARVGRLRAYGNAINPWNGAEFVRAFLAAEAEMRSAA